MVLTELALKSANFFRRKTNAKKPLKIFSFAPELGSLLGIFTGIVSRDGELTVTIGVPYSLGRNNPLRTGICLSPRKLRVKNL
jgi:hypothetical protein